MLVIANLGTGSLLGLASAFALVAAGLILIVRSLKRRGEILAKRIQLVRPPSANSGALVVVPRAADSGMYRLPTGRLTNQDREVIRRLVVIGVPAARALGVYRVGRLAMVGCLGLVAFLVALRFVPAPAAMRVSLLAAVAGMVVGWIASSMLLGRAVKRRAAKVAAGLPDALELLVVCVEAGLSLEDGIARTVTEIRQSQPELALELALTAADLKILPNRDQALANLAHRVDVPSVHSLVTTLSQTLRYGTPLAKALRSVAAELRDDSLLRIEERASELPVLLTIPMIVFIMPTIFLIAGGPAALRLIDIFLH
jgi:tight adherence protein C